MWYFTYKCLFYQEKLSDWISELQGRSENIEDLVSELELAYNSVEVKQAEFMWFTFNTKWNYTFI